MNSNAYLKARVQAVKDKLNIPITKVFTEKYPEYKSQIRKVENVLYGRQADKGITEKLEEFAELMEPETTETKPDTNAD